MQNAENKADSNGSVDIDASQAEAARALQEAQKAKAEAQRYKEATAAKTSELAVSQNRLLE